MVRKINTVCIASGRVCISAWECADVRVWLLYRFRNMYREIERMRGRETERERRDGLQEGNMDKLRKPNTEPWKKHQFKSPRTYRL